MLGVSEIQQLEKKMPNPQENKARQLLFNVYVYSSHVWNETFLLDESPQTSLFNTFIPKFYTE